MTNIQKFERLLLINRRLQATGLPVTCTLHLSYDSSFIILSHMERDKKTFSVSMTNSIEEIVEKSKKLCIPSYTQVTKICFNMLSSEFYLDKKTKVTVESINNEGVLLSNGDIVEHTRLYVKD